MPYVKDGARARLDRDGVPMNAGELNYAVTWHMLHTGDVRIAVQREVARFLEFRRKPSATAAPRENNYQDFNDVMGALDGARREYRRRVGVQTLGDQDRLDAVEYVATEFYDNVVAPYEDIKINENGDVYP